MLLGDGRNRWDRGGGRTQGEEKRTKGKAVICGRGARQDRIITTLVGYLVLVKNSRYRHL